MSEYVELWVTEPERRHPLYGVYVSLVCRGSVVETWSAGVTKRGAERRAFVKAHRLERNVGYSPRSGSRRRAWWISRDRPRAINATLAAHPDAQEDT